MQYSLLILSVLASLVTALPWEGADAGPRNWSPYCAVGLGLFGYYIDNFQDMTFRQYISPMTHGKFTLLNSTQDNVLIQMDVQCYSDPDLTRKCAQLVLRAWTQECRMSLSYNQQRRQFELNGAGGCDNFVISANQDPKNSINFKVRMPDQTDINWYVVPSLNMMKNRVSIIPDRRHYKKVNGLCNYWDNDLGTGRLLLKDGSFIEVNTQDAKPIKEQRQQFFYDWQAE